MGGHGVRWMNDDGLQPRTKVFMSLGDAQGSDDTFYNL